MNGSLGNTAVAVNNGGTLSGTGSIAGAVTVNAGGTLSPGQSPGTLTLGALTLTAGSFSNFELNTPGVVGGATNDLVNVTGNLALAGTLNATAASAGYYRLFDYGGTLSGSYNTVNAAGFSTASVLTNIPTQVNLSLLNAGQQLQFWDGADMTGNGTVDGGTGTWNATNTNWTGQPGQAGINDQWNGSVGVFQGTAGTVTVQGTQSFDTLQFNVAGYTLTGGQLALGVAGGGTINVNGVETTINSAIVNGLGSALTVVGGGVLNLGGANTFSGGLTVNNATVNANASGALGSGAVTLAAGAINVAAATTQTVAGVTVNGGTFTNAGTLNSGSVIQNLGGTFANTGVVSGGLGNAAIFTNGIGATLGGGLTNSASASNAGTINGGVVNSGTFAQTGGTTNGGLTNTATVNAQGGAINGAIANNAGTFNVLGNVTGNGLFTNAAGAALNVTGGDFTGLTGVVNAGTVQIGNGGTTGAITADIVNTGTIGINRSNTLTYGGVISGSGTVQQNGTGTTILTGASTYTGATSVNAGTLQAGAAGAFAAGSAFTVAAGATLALTSFNQTIGSLAGAGNATLGSATLTAGGNNTSTTYSGVISGTGALVKAGTGTWTLAGSETYTGATTVTAGGLIVNGSIAASSGLFVNAGAFVGGNGTLPSTTLNGTLSPGTSIGTITVAGNLTFGAGSTYVVEVSPTNADRTNVTGSASLAGALQLVPTGGSYLIGTRYTLLNAAGGLTGTFQTGNITGLFGSAIHARVAYDPNDVFLQLDPGSISPFLPPGSSANVRNVAAALDAGFAAGSPPPAFLSLFGLSSAALPGALTQLSGEIATGAAQAAFQSGDQFLQLMLDPFAGSRAETPGIALGYAAPAPQRPVGPMVTKAPPAPPAATFDARWRVWGGGFGGTGSFAGDAATGSHDLSVRNWGLAAGADYALTPDATLGFALAGGGTNFGTVGGTGRSETFQAGAYGSWRHEAAYVSGAVSYGWHELHTDRSVLLPGLADRLNADFSGNAVGARLETGWRFGVLPNIGITPFAAGQGQWFSTPSYSEADLTGLAAFTLNYGRHSWTDTRSELGARFDSVALQSRDVVLTLRGRAAWGHDFSNDRSIDAVFQNLPAAGFTVSAALPAKDAALASAGVVMKLASGITLRGSFEGQFAGSTHVYSGMGSVSYAW